LPAFPFQNNVQIVLFRWLILKLQAGIRAGRTDQNPIDETPVSTNTVTFGVDELQEVHLRVGLPLADEPVALVPDVAPVIVGIEPIRNRRPMLSIAAAIGFALGPVGERRRLFRDPFPFALMILL